MPHVSIAVIVDDQVVAMTDDAPSVRVCAALVGAAPHRAEHPFLRPIAEGRRRSCEAIATGLA